GVEHVGLVHRAERALALARRLEAHPGDAAYLRLRIEHRIEAFRLAGGVLPPATWRPEVDVSRELAHDHEIEAGDDFGLEARSGGELRVEQRWSQIGEERELLADRKDALLRAKRARQRVVSRTADGTHQQRIGGLRERERCLWERLS